MNKSKFEEEKDKKVGETAAFIPSSMPKWTFFLLVGFIGLGFFTWLYTIFFPKSEMALRQKKYNQMVANM